MDKLKVRKPTEVLEWRLIYKWNDDWQKVCVRTRWGGRSMKELAEDYRE